jgi:hypothetical protein
MIMPNVEEEAVTATLKEGVYPRRIMDGISTDPIPAVSAWEDPEIPANSILTITLMCPKPPWI